MFMFSTLGLMANGAAKKASHKELSKWFVSPMNSEATIEMFYDKSRKTKVCKLQGNGTRSSYIYRFNQKLEASKVLSWSMLYQEDYVIMVVVNTLQGKRSLIYTPSTTQTYLQFGLGQNAMSNAWQKYYRDLESDLQRYEPRNKIVTLEYFVVRGSGLIEIPKLEKMKQNLPSKPPMNMMPLKTMPSPTSSKHSQMTPALPKIKILGDNPLILKRGQAYTEQGVVARDTDGSILQVDSTHTIDAYKEGEYSVIYMSTNKLGNTAVDRRVVRVGNVPMTQNTSREQKQEQEQEEEEIMEEEQEEVSSPSTAPIEALLPSEKQVKEPKKTGEGFPERPGL